jgi:hypothetical protein
MVVAQPLLDINNRASGNDVGSVKQPISVCHFPLIEKA